MYANPMNCVHFSTPAQNGIVSAPHHDQLHVLLVHANETGPEQLVELFQSVGASVEQTRLGLEANRLIPTGTFDVLMLHSDDYAATVDHLNHWRNEGLKAPAIIVTESASQILTSHSEGVVLTIPESIDAAELRSRLNALRRVCRGETHVLEVFDLRIDLLLRTVERAGQLITLTPREFGLLEFLATQPGKVVSRRLILDHVFGITDFLSSNVVDVYIRTLRKKIDQDHSNKLIETRRGYGYLLRNQSNAE